ncbi:hypothetical protein EAI_09084, partial [Harpegnathos saltator]
FLIKHGIVQLRQPLYSPDIVLCDFWLFLKLKHPLKGNKAKCDEEAVGYESCWYQKNDFQDCFRKWVHRWQKVIVSEGNYFEDN